MTKKTKTAIAEPPVVNPIEGPVDVLDLFAGSGWGVAAKKLGLREAGVEIMKAAQLTREINGMHTLFHNVWDGLTPGWQDRIGNARGYTTLLASPPCQSFSQGGQGKGRQYLDVVLDLISKDAHLDVEELQNSVGILGDEKTALVLTPLAYALRDMPKFVAFEQVPSVKPVWEASAEKMREAGYNVWTGTISSEVYGVPQARRRAYLLASLEGEITPPPATHSLYYSRNPTKLDEGVKKWVTMAEGLGRSKKETAALPEWAHTRPSTTIVGSFRPDIIAAPGWRKPGDGPRQNTPNSIQVDLREAGLLQSYPDGFEFGGSKANQWLQVGNAVPPGVAEAVLRHFYEM